MLCPLLCPWLRALTRAGPRGPAARERRGAAMFPACCCAGKARPRLLLPLDPYGHGLLPAVHPDGGRGRAHGKRKSWNFIHEKMSYDTFFTMKRLIERSRSVGEVLRWVTQNPGKVSASHYPIALHKLGQLLQQQPGPPAGAGDGRGPAGQVLEQPEFHVLCQAIVSGCAKFDNFSIVNCLYAAAALGEPPRADTGWGAQPCHRASPGSWALLGLRQTGCDPWGSGQGAQRSRDALLLQGRRAGCPLLTTRLVLGSPAWQGVYQPLLGRV